MSINLNRMNPMLALATDNDLQLQDLLEDWMVHEYKQVTLRTDMKTSR
jgi:hypothetical protein